MKRIPAIHLATLVLLAGLALTPPAHATGAWSTYLRMETTSDILATRDTVLIASGEAGLVRYLRGSGTFESVTREPGGLASNNLTALAYDRSGQLWVGTAGKGASRFRILADSKEKWDLVNAFDGLPSDTVNVFRADGDTIWIGTTRGIALWDGHQVAGAVPDLGTPSPFRDNGVTGIAVVGDTLFVATGDGIFLARLSQNLSTWSELDAGIPDLAITALAQGGGELFALAGGNVYLWDRANTWTAVPVGDVVAKLRDDYGVVYAISPSGLVRWNGGGWSGVGGAWGTGSGSAKNETGQGPSGDLFQVHNGTLFMRVGTATTFSSTTPPGPLSNFVLTTYHDGQAVWVGTNGQGVSRFDGTTWRGWPGRAVGMDISQDTTFANSSYPIAIRGDRRGYLWFVTSGKAVERVNAQRLPYVFQHVYAHDQINFSDTLDSHTIGWPIIDDADGFVYIGGNTNSIDELEPMGIDVYDTSGVRVLNMKTTSANLGSNMVRGLAVHDKTQTLWAGFAAKGVSWASISTMNSGTSGSGNDHRKLPAFQKVNDFTATNESDINCIVIHDDDVWVLTSGNLHRLNANTRTLTSRYDIPAGPPPSLGVHLLDVAPDGTVWVGSVDGVRMYPPKGVPQDFRVDNSPLADNEVHSVNVERSTGAVWISTLRGLNRFDPHYTAPPPPAIASLKVQVWPNPVSMNGTGIQLRLAGNTASYAGEIVDIGGRVVRRFKGAANQGTVWDGRDQDGRLVRAGMYFVHAHAGGHEATARIVVLR